MIIERVRIDRFGKLAGEEIEFSDGINIVYGPNESGKSTLLGFIINMLFGMNRARGKASKTDDFARFEPKELPLEYSGSMEFDCDGEKYTLSRNFAAGKKHDTLVSKEKKELFSDVDAKIQELLCGVTKNLYGNTQSVSQEAVTDRAYLVSALTDRYAAFDSGDGYEGTVSRSLKELSAERKQYESQNRKLKKERDEAVTKVKSQISYVESEIALLREKLAEAERKAASQKNFKEENKLEERPVEKRKTAAKKGRIPALIAKLIFIAAAVLLVTGIFVFDRGILLSVFSAAFLFVIGLMLHVISKYIEAGDGTRSLTSVFTGLIKQEEKDKSSENEDAVFLKYIQDTLRSKELSLAKLRSKYDETAGSNAQIDALDIKIEGLRLAEETIEKIAGRSKAKHEKRFRERVSHIFEYLSADEERKLVFDENEEPALSKGGLFIPFWQCSAGTRDIIELSMRLAAGELLSDGARLPVLLDDVLVYCDDDRLKRVLMFLKNKKRQVILFSCHKREIEALNELEIEYRLVRWSGNAAAY